MGTAAANPPVRRRRRRFVRTMEVLLSAIVVVLAAVAVFLAIAIRNGPDGQTTFLGQPIYSVASGSMAPAVNTGDLIIDRHISLDEAEDLHKGQIITFNSAPAPGVRAGLVITHRIYAVVRSAGTQGTSTVSYRTKGDANDSPDVALVQPSAIIGVYQRQIPYGGYVVGTLHQPVTFVVLIMIPVVLLVGGEIKRRWVRLGEEDARRRRGTQVDDTAHP